MKHGIFNPFRVLRNDNPDDNGGGGGEEQHVEVVQQVDPIEAKLSGIIESSFAKIADRMPAPTQQAPQQLSPEEIKKALKVYEPTEELAQEFRAALAEEHGKGSMRKVLGKIFAGLSDQSATYANLHAAKLRQDIDTEYAPVKAHLSEAKKTAAKKTFFNEYPQLKDFEEIIPAVAQRLAPETTQGKSDKEVRQLLATHVEAMIKKIRPDFALTTSQANGGPNARPAAMSSGGQGGPSGPSAKSGSSSIWS